MTAPRVRRGSWTARAASSGIRKTRASARAAARRSRRAAPPAGERSARARASARAAGAPLERSAAERAAPSAAAPPEREGGERRQLTVRVLRPRALDRALGAAGPRGLGRGAGRVPEGGGRRRRPAYGGHVAQHLGDGLLAYFGWPHALDDAAERAVRAGLALIDAAAGVSVEGRALAARVGIHTGTVVVGALGERRERRRRSRSARCRTWRRACSPRRSPGRS